ncbi:hypothetical protein [Pseudonocardia sp. HH130630-07]|uniref:hypothetical protein n=1 Tax=Pseudonocardia sp. HH130630-07 TaxID=1690815 RepID=UPI000814D6E3|nr:hypothetical protein [Pseudonocardia sp. HH130630-07]ANY05829.1 hypothetical protein AFB00_05410 [Pseudonocardia sp. HH130630-07]
MGLAVGGGAPAAVHGARVVFALPERTAIDLYGRGDWDLPAAQVHDVVVRFAHGDLAIDDALVHRLLDRYLRTGGGLAAGTRDAVSTRLGELSGDARALPHHDLDGRIRAGLARVAQEVRVSLAEPFATRLGQSSIETATLRTPAGAPARLFAQVRDAVAAQLPPGTLAHDPLLWQQLWKNLAGKRWWGKLDAMLDRDGFSLQATVRIPEIGPGGVAVPGADRLRRIEVWITARLVDDARLLDSTTAAGQINQDYGYLQHDRSGSWSRTTGGGTTVDLAPGDGGAGLVPSVSTDHSRGATGGISTQRTRLDGTASFGGSDRIAQGVRITVTARAGGGLLDRGTAAPTRVVLDGSLVRLVPAGIATPVPAGDRVAGTQARSDGDGPADPRPLVLPRVYSAEAVEAPGLVDTVVDALAARGMLGRTRAEDHRADLEHVFAANALTAFLRDMLTGEGHLFHRIPAGGRTVVDVVVRADLYGAQRLLRGWDLDKRTVRRFQEQTTTGTSDARMAPVGRGATLAGEPGSIGLSGGDQSGHRGAAVAGTRAETTLILAGKGGTARTELGLVVELRRGTLTGYRDEPAVRRTVTARDRGTAYLTLFDGDLTAALAAQETPARDDGGWRLRTGHGHASPFAPHPAGPGPGAPGTAGQLTDARRAAIGSGRPVVVELPGGGRARAGPDGALHGVRDGGYAAALASLPPELLAAAAHHLPDLRRLHAAGRGPFAAVVRDALARRGLPVALDPAGPAPAPAGPGDGPPAVEASTGYSSVSSGPVSLRPLTRAEHEVLITGPSGPGTSDPRSARSCPASPPDR